METRTGWLRTALDWALRTEGSTRSSALIRIGLVLLLWARWGSELTFTKHLADGNLPMCVVFYGSTTLLLFGVWTKVSAPLAALSTLWLVYGMGHLQGVEAYTHHHTTLLAWSMVWLALTPCGTSYSVDRWLALRRAERAGRPAPPETGALWGLRLMSLQVAALYYWTAVDKLTVGFLSGERLQQMAMDYYTGSSEIGGGLVGALFVVVAWFTVATEFALAFGLFFRRTRRWLVPVGLVLHGGIHVLLGVQTFTPTMWLLYLAFFPADEVHRFIERLSGHPAPEPEPEPSLPEVAPDGVQVGQ